MSKKRKLEKEIKQWINYLKKDCNAANWDWAYLLGMEREKLKRMSDWFEKNGLLSNISYNVSRMQLAVRLLDIILDHPDSPSINLKNANRFVSQDIMRMLETSKIDKSIVIEEIRVQKAWYLYNKLRLYFLMTWWI